jgi:hypothetical protein
MLTACGGGSAPPEAGDPGNHIPAVFVVSDKSAQVVIRVFDQDGDFVVVTCGDETTPEPLEGYTQHVENGDGELTFNFPPVHFTGFAPVWGYDGKDYTEVSYAEVRLDPISILREDSLLGTIGGRIHSNRPDDPWNNTNPITVATGPTSGGFRYLDVVWLSLPASYRYSPGAFTAWLPLKDFLLYDRIDEMMSNPLPLPDGRVGVGVSLSPIEGADEFGKEGPLFKFGAFFPNGLIDVRFIQPPAVQRSYYSSNDGTKTYWSDLSNDYPEQHTSIVNTGS